MVLEDVIRSGLSRIFSMFHMQVTEAFPIKITKDAELEIEDNVTSKALLKLFQSTKRRVRGEPVRLTYDHHISQEFLHF